MKSVPFWKTEGCGNDFILLLREGPCSDPEFVRAMTPALCERRFGIGADGVLLVGRDRGELEMIVFNADGGRPEMCGNGLRCAVLWAAQAGWGEVFSVRTDAGVRGVELLSSDGIAGEVRIDLGLPRLVPTATSASRLVEDHEASWSLASFGVVFGNPHVVVWGATRDHRCFEPLGRALQTVPWWGEGGGATGLGVNAHLVEVLDDTRLRMHSFERGVGSTLACGTGAGAATVLGRPRLGDGPVHVELRRGHFVTRLRGERCELEGPARVICRGTWPLPTQLGA